jgi:hypothetical protein
MVQNRLNGLQLLRPCRGFGRRLQLLLGLGITHQPQELEQLLRERLDLGVRLLIVGDDLFQ